MIIYNISMDEKIFDRIEKKYIITKKQYEILLSQIQKHMKKDGYFKSEVYNIYFDTDNYDLIIQSIDQPIFKEKLRARSYGGYDKVFLEIKTKLRGEAMTEKQDYNLGFKRRVLITHQDYDDLIAKKSNVTELAPKSVEKPSDLQIAKEIDYMLDYFKLTPKILVYYDRESYKGNDGLRVTFDKNLKYREENLKFNKNTHDKTLSKDDKCIIMEIKTHGGLPMWLVKALSAEHIYPMQFSKIGKVYELIKKGEKNV